MVKIPDLPEREKPLSERYRLAALAWREADRRAKYYKENKEAVLSQMVLKAMQLDPTLATNKAERQVKGSEAWQEFVNKLVDASNKAADLRIELKSLEIEAEEIKQANINAARERRYG